MAWYGDGHVPAWVDGAKSEVMAGREWRAIERELRRGINELMAEANPTGSGLFSELSADEQRAVVDRAAAALKDSEGYGDLVRVTSRTLNRALNQAIETRSTDPTFDHNHSSKADLCVAESAAAATTLLQRWPDQQGRLAVCLNQRLPPDLRQRAWSLMLLNRPAVAEYIDLYSNGILHVTSKDDAGITNKCELLLNGSPLLGTRVDGRGSVASTPMMLYGMKAMLSFHHLKSGTVKDMDYLMAVPFAWVFFGPLVTNPVVAEMAAAVSVYRRFLETLPPVVTDGKACVDAVAGVLGMLAQADPGLHTTLSTVPGRGGKGGDGRQGGRGGDIGNTPESELTRLIRPMVATLFVGFVPIDLACFLWDQYMLSNASPRTVQLSVAAVLLAMAGHLRRCETADALVGTIAAHAKQLTVSAVQRCIQTHLLGYLQTEVNAGVVPQAFPTIGPGPAIASMPAWSWSTIGTPAPARDPAAAPNAANNGESSIAQSITNAMMMDQSLIDLATTDPAYFAIGGDPDPDTNNIKLQSPAGTGQPPRLNPSALQATLPGNVQDNGGALAALDPDNPADSRRLQLGPSPTKLGAPARIRRRESRSPSPKSAYAESSSSIGSLYGLSSSQPGPVDVSADREVLVQEVAEMEARRDELAAILESNNDAAPAPGTPPALPGHWSSSGDLTNKSATDIFMDIVAASMDSVMALARDSNANP